MEQKHDWWLVDDESLLLKINTPVTDSKEEWARAFLDLSKVVIEGFQRGPIHALLIQEGISFKKEEGTIRLLERLATSRNPAITELEGLRLAQSIRSKLNSHREGSTANEIAKSALLQHGSYRLHFEYVCDLIVEELDGLEHVIVSLRSKH